MNKHASFFLSLGHLLAVFLFFQVHVSGQPAPPQHPDGGDITAYLANHYYPFSLDSGFDQRTQDSLVVKLAGYRLVLQAEGGSHELNFYTKLPMVWVSFLGNRLGLTRIFMETGHCADLILNRYLLTGDTARFPFRLKEFWKDLYDYDHQRPEGQRVQMRGVDFDYPLYYVTAMKQLLPAGAPPAAISGSIDLIRSLPDSTRDCDLTMGVNEKLRKALDANEADFKQYFGAAYQDLSDIVHNPGVCADRRKNRNGHMAERLVMYARREALPVYYAEFGMAHTLLNNSVSMGYKLNHMPEFQGKVCTVNLFCQDCIAPGGLSNWPLHKIEPDIVQYFLPYCKGNFTLFDLTGDDPVIQKYREYGQFLIIAKGVN